MRTVLAVAMAVVLGAALTACITSEASPGAGTMTGTVQPTTTTSRTPTRTTPSTAVPLRTANARSSGGVIARGGEDAPYNYGPTVMAEGGQYRMWWCSQLGIANPPGDDILYATSRSLDGGFGGPDGRLGTPILAGSFQGFDAVHVCDPSVIKVGATYYMYYTGWGGNHDLGNSIGLATSPDGRVWTRVGRPIVEPAREVRNDNLYGAGQPSAVYLDGWYYLMFTDTSARGVGEHGIGQFLLRAKDPAFATGVETLTANGFQPGTQRARSVAEAFSADLMWVAALGAFAIAFDTGDGTTITFWDKDFRVKPYSDVLLAGPWREGPGLVREPDGHAAVALDRPCDTVRIDLVRGSKEGRHGPTDLMRFGLDLVDVGACGTTEAALRTLDGFAIPSPERTVDLIVGGSVIRVDRRSVAELLATRILDYRLRVLDQVPVAARITPELAARRAPGRGVGLLIDGRLWPVPSADVAARNSSRVVDITPAQWDSYALGSALVSAR